MSYDAECEMWDCIAEQDSRRLEEAQAACVAHAPVAPPIEVCAGCGQTLLTTPDDPMTALWCDTCEGGVK